MAKTVINTLTKQDYVNVICARLISGSVVCYFSESMRGEKFDIAKGVAKTVINTLTKQDYVNVMCARLISDSIICYCSESMRGEKFDIAK